jgi:hypothetical protein
MKRAYTFLSLLIITSALRLPFYAQRPINQAPITTRPSYTEEALRRRASTPSIDSPRVPPEDPILRIETSVLRLPSPNPSQGPHNLMLKNLSTLYDTALFQRQRFRETGQPIQFERGFLYFRQDRYVVTKGLILYRMWDDRIDIGIYKRTFNDDASPARGQALFFGPTDPSSRNRNYNSNRQIFFGIRFNLDKKSGTKH